jgi:hypothetical protein
MRTRRWNEESRVGHAELRKYPVGEHRVRRLATDDAGRVPRRIDDGDLPFRVHKAVSALRRGFADRQPGYSNSGEIARPDR